jgi:hypothetical protein
MVEGENITRAVIEVLELGKFPYMLVGSFSSNMYGIARSTKDADFVVDVADRTVMPRLFKELNHLLEFNPQASFEGLTGSTRHEAMARSYPFRVEFFEKANDPFAVARFARRVRHPSTVFGCDVWIPTAEDVVIQKLRWARDKDLADARDVMAVQGPALDHGYIEVWSHRLDILDRYQSIRASVHDI